MEFLPAQALGAAGFTGSHFSCPLSIRRRRWLILTAQHPKEFAGRRRPGSGLLARQRTRLLLCFDERAEIWAVSNEIARSWTC